MNQIRKRLTYANVMSSIAVFMILGGATAIAAKNLPKKSVGTPQLKAKAVKTAKIAKNAVNTAKLKNNAVSTPKIRNNAVTGAKINESTLGEVPSAASAANLIGQTPFFFRLGFGQQQLIASHGVVSLTAVCDQDGGNDRARILMATTQDGAVANGADNFTGAAGNFLNVATVPDDREFVSRTTVSGQTSVGADTNEGFVIGPDSKMLSSNSDGLALGLNYGAPGCLFGGIVNALG